MDHIDTIIAGAGVVGIAVARVLAQAGHEVMVLEAEEGIGTGVSSRNSEVIHAGIYYPKDSLMARLCVAGRRKLYAFCDERGVPYAKCGKLIVATSAKEDDKLAGIKARAEANGVEGMRVLTAAEAREFEPNRPRPVFSTATPICWPSKVRPKRRGRCSCFTRQSQAVWRAMGGLRSAWVGRRRCSCPARISSTRRGWGRPGWRG